MNRVALLRKTFLEAMRGRGQPIAVSISAVTFMSPLESLEERLRKADSLV